MSEPSLSPGDVALIGIASDHNSSFMRGPALAPPVIRRVMHNGSANLVSESGTDIGASRRFVDLGDREVGEDDASFLALGDHIAGIAAAGARPLVLGGDHAITWPAVRAVAAVHGPLDILHFDAHTDLYDVFEGNSLSHACPFARIMESGSAKRLVQIGIRTLTAHHREQIARFGVEVHEARTLEPRALSLAFQRPVYLSFDIDALDPSAAPGVSHHEPGGLSVRDALHIIQGFEGRLVGADIVEFNPQRDLHDMTAMVAVKLVKELAGRMLSDH